MRKTTFKNNQYMTLGSLRASSPGRSGGRAGRPLTACPEARLYVPFWGIGE